MQAATQIREALSQVAVQRQTVALQPPLAQALNAIKQLQAQRFAGSYHDLMADSTYAPCAQFFLNELYSDKDYAERDAQFARIASAIERTFPAQVVATTVALADLHRLTEALDLAMAQHWLSQPGKTSAQRYLASWQGVGQRAERQWQLDTVLRIGQSLGQLTRKPGLRLMLKMMRKPAQMAGLGSLQNFLESGFKHFADLAHHKGTVSCFLDTVKTRESAWLDCLFDASPVRGEAELTHVLGLAP